MTLPSKPQSRAGMPPRKARVLLGASAKVGKALALDTPIVTPDGWTTMGEVSEGDKLFDRWGCVTTVTAATGVMRERPCVRVGLRSSEPIVADTDHQWVVLRGSKELVVETGDLRVGDRIPVAGSLLCDHADLPVDPYSLGVWLGDGSSESALVHLYARDYEEIEAAMALPLERRREKANTVSALMGRGSAQRTLRATGLLGNKHIPPVYLRASEKQRMNLLRGIMDTDGHVSKNGTCEITTVREQFAADLLELASSLGFKAWCGEGRATIAGRDCGAKWRVTFHPGDEPVCGLLRKYKALRATSSTRTSYRRIVSLEPVESVPVRCLQVDSPTRTYLAGRQMIPTHNTTLLGNWAPATTLIVDTHHGTELLEGEHYVAHVRDWPGFVGIVNDLVRTQHSFETVGLDVIGDLWRMADLHFGTTKDGLKTPASGTNDYGRSSAKARSAFEAEIGRLLAAPVGIWFIAHLREKTDKEGQLVVYAPDMDKAVHGYIMGAVDFVWLAETLPNGRRVVHTQPTPHFEAGSRVPLPSPLPLDAGEIAKVMDQALNPQKYTQPEPATSAQQEDPVLDPFGLLKVPETVEEPVEDTPPVAKDIERTGATDVPADTDPWFEEVRPLLKGIPSEGLRAAVTAAAGAVPEKVSSWARVICALDPDQRVVFIQAVGELQDMPWESPEIPGQLAIDETQP